MMTAYCKKIEIFFLQYIKYRVSNKEETNHGRKSKTGNAYARD